MLSSACTELMTAWSVCNRWRHFTRLIIVIVLMVFRSFKERIQETEEAHGLLNNHLQTNVLVNKLAKLNLILWVKMLAQQFVTF